MGDIERVKRLVAYYRKAIRLILLTSWEFYTRSAIVKTKAAICS